MKVKCIRLVGTLGIDQVRSAWLTRGKTYHVLSIAQDVEQHKWYLRLAGDTDSGVVGLFLLEQFEIVSAKLPSSWIAIWHTNGMFEFTTNAWGRPGFWEDYHEHDAEAVLVFDQEARRIVGEDP
jgi:hypothetical protein